MFDTSEQDSIGLRVWIKVLKALGAAIDLQLGVDPGELGLIEFSIRGLIEILDILGPAGSGNLRLRFSIRR